MKNGTSEMHAHYSELVFHSKTEKKKRIRVSGFFAFLGLEMFLLRPGNPDYKCVWSTQFFFPPSVNKDSKENV